MKSIKLLIFTLLPIAAVRIVFPLPILAGPADEPLPIWLGENEVTLPPEQWYENPNRDLPPAGSHLPAEYEPAEAVVISWMAYTTMLTAIAQAGAAAGAEIWCTGSSAPASISGVPAEMYMQINTCPLNSVWMRDYGPFGIHLPGGTTGIVDSQYRRYQQRPLDDALPCCLAGFLGMNCYSINTAGTGSDWLILDGGNVMVDTTGILYMTRATYNWNDYLTEAEVHDAIMDYFGVHTIRVVDYVGYPDFPADGTGHIDMIAKLLDDHTVLVANADSSPTFDPTLETIAADFAGWGLTVIRVDCTYSGYTWYTYTNSLIVNDSVLIPEYSSFPSLNTAAVSVYQAAMPGTTVVAINSDSSITSGGSIHCVTQLIPVPEGGNTPTPTPVHSATPSPTVTSNPPTSTPVLPTSTPVPPTSTPVPPTATVPTGVPTNTAIPPTATPVPPTSTPVPPTATVPTGVPTNTSAPATNTPIPTYTPVPPTDTPVPPTDTPVPPTDTPIPSTATPAPPTSTPTAGPPEPAIDLELNRTVYRSGDPFIFTCRVTNTGAGCTVSQYILLDIYGSFWFWPGWTESLDFMNRYLDRGFNDTETVFDFTWPEVGGSAAGLRFWGALLDPETMTLMGEYDMVEFSY
ncbi:agmatine deiminase family protein [bacterium]|nr:agmatine deiminase family protein [candidate division CSSED10-310 bacterium]